MDESATQPGASISDIVVALNQGHRNTSLLIQTMSSILPRISGTFTLASSGPNTTVTQPAVKANSILQWWPNNSSAATLCGSIRNIYPSTINAGANFIMSTANAANASGTEVFQYVVLNLV